MSVQMTRASRPSHSRLSTQLMLLKIAFSKEKKKEKEK